MVSKVQDTNVRDNLYAITPDSPVIYSLLCPPIPCGKLEHSLYRLGIVINGNKNGMDVALEVIHSKLDRNKYVQVQLQVQVHLPLMLSPTS